MMDVNDIKYVVLIAQGLSALIAVTSTLSTVLSRAGASCPTLQSCLCYLLLAIVFGLVANKRGRNTEREDGGPVEKWWKYALLALLDVEANVCVVMAFRYTSITSVTLLDQWSIPVVVVLTRILGMAKYGYGHAAGVGLCVAGLLLLVANDGTGGGQRLDAADQYGTPTLRNRESALSGDLLVLCGSTLYGCANVLQEKLLQDVAFEQVLAKLGVWAFGLGIVQGWMLEGNAFLHIQWSNSNTMAFVFFSIALFGFYSAVPFVLDRGGATLLNLSLLSSDVWTALIRILLFGGFSTWNAVVFAASFSLVCTGISIYSLSGSVKEPSETVVYETVRRVEDTAHDP